MTSLTRRFPDGAVGIGAIVAVGTLPAITLAVQGGTNQAFFVLALCSLMGAASRLGRTTDGGESNQAWYWAACSWTLAVMLSQAFRGDWWGRPYDATFRLTLTVPVVWWLSQQAPARLRHAQWGILLGAVAGAVSMVYWIPAGGGRPEPDYATSITFGNLSLLMGVLAWLSLGWKQTASRLEPAAKWAAGALGIYGSFLSGSRGGWLAIPVFAVLLALAWGLSRRARIAAICLLPLVLVSVYVASPNVQQRFVEAGTDVSSYLSGAERDTSIGMRFQMWHAASEMFMAHPLTGVGAGKFNEQLRLRHERGEVSETVAEFDHAHNDFLWFAGTLGIPGVLALLAIFGVPGWHFYRRASDADVQVATAARMGLAVVLGYVVFGLTEAMFSITMNAAFYGGMVSLFWVLSRRQVGR